MGNELYKIGDLAQLSGVPIKTIRHYSDIGVLPPAATTRAGFRLYSNSDRARLELIRSLREAGFGLSAIKELLQNEISISSALGIQLNAVEENLRRLRRQRTLLKAALDQGDSGTLAYLKHTRVLINLDRIGRERFLDKHMGRAVEGVGGPPDWKVKLWKEGVLNFPEEIDGDQFKAWLELAELMLEPSYIRHLNEMMKAYWNFSTEGKNIEEWRKSQDQVFTQALEAAQQGEVPQGPRAQVLVQCYIDVNATVFRRDNDFGFLQELLLMREKLADLRVRRYWELVGILKGQPPEKMWSKYQAHSWLVEGLKQRVV